MVLKTNVSLCVLPKLFLFVELAGGNFFVPLTASEFSLRDFGSVEPMLQLVAVEDNLGGQDCDSSTLGADSPNWESSIP